MIFNNQENEEYFCVYLDSYHPYWMDRANGIRNSGFNGFSSRILDLKQGDWGAINYFYNEISPIINNGIAIAIVPSHKHTKDWYKVRGIYT